MVEIRDIWLHANVMIRTARQVINEGLGPLNLSSAEGNILLHLLTHGEEMGQEQLVEELDISKPGVSRALSSLEGKGFVTRRRDAQDRRARRVRLTEQARAIGATVEEVYNRVYALAVQGISEEELATFVELFGRMAENFTEMGTGSMTEAQGA